MRILFLITLSLLIAAGSVYAQSKKPKYKFSKWTSGPPKASYDFHSPGSHKFQCIYRSTELPGLPEGEISSVYLRVGRTYGSTVTPNPTNWIDVRLKMGYTQDTGFIRKTGATYDSFKANLTLVYYQPFTSIYGADTPGTWVRFPLNQGNFSYQRTKNLVVEVSRPSTGTTSTNYGFDWMANNICFRCALPGFYDSTTSPYTAIGYQLDIGFNDSTGPASVALVRSLKGFYTYPNPNNGLFTVGFEPSHTLEPIALSVADMTGRQVWQRIYNDVSADLFTANVDLRNMPKGCYLLQVQKGMDRSVQRVIIE